MFKYFFFRVICYKEKHVLYNINNEIKKIKNKLIFNPSKKTQTILKIKPKSTMPGKPTIYTQKELDVMSTQFHVENPRIKRAFLSKREMITLRLPPSKMKTASDKVLREKALGKIRARRYRKNNKPEALDEDKEVKNLEKKNKQLEERNERLANKVEEKDRVINTITQLKDPTPDQITVWPVEEALKYIQTREYYNKGKKTVAKQNTISSDKTNLNHLLKNFEECASNLIPCIKDKEKLLRIMHAMNSDSAKISFARTMLVFAEYLQPRTDITEKYVQEIRDLYQKKDVKYREDRAEKITSRDKEDVLPTYPMYLKRCAEEFGTDSVEYLLALLYQKIPLRSEPSNMKIAHSESYINRDDDENYIVFPNGKVESVYIQLNNYKTEQKYGKKIYPNKLFTAKNKDLIKALKRYVDDRELEEGDKIFGSSANFNNIVSNMNKKLLFKKTAQFGINNFRHLIVSTFYYENRNVKNKNRMLNMRIELAKLMNHSLQEQAQYRREIDIEYYK